MGLFLQTALFPGCDESIARDAVEAAAKNPVFYIDLEACRYAQSYEGTQVLIEGDTWALPRLQRPCPTPRRTLCCCYTSTMAIIGAMIFTVETKKITSTRSRTTSAQSARKKNSA